VRDAHENSVEINILRFREAAYVGFPSVSTLRPDLAHATFRLRAVTDSSGTITAAPRLYHTHLAG
jgi:hypothetical protein